MSDGMEPALSHYKHPVVLGRREPRDVRNLLR